MDPKPVAVVCSDIHLSHNPPVFRSDEPDWYSAMERTLDQVATVCREEGNLSLIIAGDIFDRWNSPAELISFAMDEFSGFPRKVYAIPGQHDLPNHRYEEIDRSAYGVLMRNEIVNMIPGECIDSADDENFISTDVYGFPWGFDLKSSGPGPEIRVAIVHRYLWEGSAGFPGAPIENHVDNLIHDYDLVISGDNHIPFACFEDDRIKVFNCGGLFRRKSDDRHDPRVGILYEDGSILGKKLDCSEDKYAAPVSDFEAEEFDPGVVEIMTAMDFDSIDFREMVSHKSKVLRDEVAEMVMRDVEGE